MTINKNTAYHIKKLLQYTLCILALMSLVHAKSDKKGPSKAEALCKNGGCTSIMYSEKTSFYFFTFYPIITNVSYGVNSNTGTIRIVLTVAYKSTNTTDAIMATIPIIIDSIIAMMVNTNKQNINLSFLKTNILSRINMIIAPQYVDSIFIEDLVVYHQPKGYRQ